MNQLSEGAKQRSLAKQERTRAAILEMLETGQRINFYTVAEKAEVSRAFIYQHEELRQKK